MEDEKFDHPEEEEFYSGKIVAVKYFYAESEARLYTARLREAGIRSFLSNANTSNTLPLGEGGVGLHVKESDLDAALKIIKQLDLFNLKENSNESFHDADKDDIAYERDLQKGKGKINRTVFIVILLIAIAVVLRAFLRAINWVPNWDIF